VWANPDAEYWDCGNLRLCGPRYAIVRRRDNGFARAYAVGLAGAVEGDHIGTATAPRGLLGDVDALTVVVLRDRFESVQLLLFDGERLGVDCYAGQPGCDYGDRRGRGGALVIAGDRRVACRDTNDEPRLGHRRDRGARTRPLRSVGEIDGGVVRQSADGSELGP